MQSFVTGSQRVDCFAPLAAIRLEGRRVHLNLHTRANCRSTQCRMPPFL